MLRVEPTSAWILAYVAGELEPGTLSTWVTRTRRAIEAELPDLLVNPDLGHTLDGTVRDLRLRFLSALAQMPRDVSPPPGVRLAEGLLPLRRPDDTVTSIVSIVRDRLFDRLTEGDIPPDLRERARRWLDESTAAAAVEAHEEALARPQVAPTLQHSDLVRLLLDKTGLHAEGLHEAAAGLGTYPVSAVHTGFMLHSTRTGSTISSAESVHRAAHEARSALGGSLLTVQLPGADCWAWVATRHAPSAARLAGLEETFVRRGVHACVGVPQAGLSGFGATHREATMASDVTSRGDLRPGLTLFPGVELVSMLGCTTQVDRFVVRTLGPLSGIGPHAERMRETLAALLDFDGSMVTAAQHLRVHRNTIRYRLDRIDESLPGSRAGLHTELSVAVRHMMRFHPAGIDVVSETT